MRSSRVHMPSLAETQAVTASRYADPERWPDRLGHLPPLEGAAPLTGSFPMRPIGTGGANVWTRIGGKATAWEEVNQAFLHTEVPSTLRGIESSTKGVSSSFVLQTPVETLAVARPGAKLLAVLGGTTWVYGEGVGTVNTYTFKTTESVTVNEKTFVANGAQWESLALSGTLLTEIQGHLTIRPEGVVITLKAHAAACFCFYVELEVEYEQARAPHNYGQAVNRAATY